MRKFVAGFVRDESGATAIEYGLITALLSPIVVAAMLLIGPELNTTFTTFGNVLATANH